MKRRDKNKAPKRLFWPSTIGKVLFSQSQPEQKILLQRIIFMGLAFLLLSNGVISWLYFQNLFNLHLTQSSPMIHVISSNLPSFLPTSPAYIVSTGKSPLTAHMGNAGSGLVRWVA